MIEEFDTSRQLLAIGGAERRKILKTTLLAHGVMEKGVAISYEQNRRPTEKIYPEWLMYLEGQLNQGLNALEKIASSSSEWLHGDTITVADITTVCLIDYLGIRMPENMENRGISALLALSEKANAIDAIGKTRPNI